MASTYSPLLRLELIAAGEQAGLWGNTTNGNLGTLVEQAIAGVTAIDLTPTTPTTYTLSTLNGAFDEARSAVILVQGAPAAARTVVVPSQHKTYIAKNTTGQTVTFKTAAQVGGVDVIAGGATVVFCDGTNVLSAISNTDVSQLVGVLPVANGGTGSSTATGSGAAVLAVSPALTGTPTVPTRTFGDNTTAAANTAFVQAAVATGAGSAVPVGSVVMWPTASPPANYVLCNGQALSRTTNATLFGVLGITFGAGDGTTTFNVPNYLNRVPIGAGNLYATAGLTGGSKDSIVPLHSHTVSASGSTSGESALHTHGVSDPGHQHVVSIPAKPNGTGGGPQAMVDGASPITNFVSIATDADGTGISLGTQTVGHTHTVTVSGSTSTIGSSAVNANLPPYISMFFIMKAA